MKSIVNNSKYRTFKISLKKKDLNLSRQVVINQTLLRYIEQLEQQIMILDERLSKFEPDVKKADFPGDMDNNT